MGKSKRMSGSVFNGLKANAPQKTITKEESKTEKKPQILDSVDQSDIAIKTEAVKEVPTITEEPVLKETKKEENKVSKEVKKEKNEILSFASIQLTRSQINKLSEWSKSVTALRKESGERITSSKIIQCLVNELISKEDKFNLNQIHSKEELQSSISKALIK
jgi:hypothetical protein